jgi:alpha-methylacyl-CoA racemase
LVDGLGIRDRAPDRDDPANHPALRELIETTVRGRTLAEWTEVFAGTDACVAPVLPLSDAVQHPHLVARSVYVDRGNGPEPAPAPRFSRTAATLSTPPPAGAGQDTRAALAAWGIEDVDALLESGAAVQS